MHFSWRQVWRGWDSDSEAAGGATGSLGSIPARAGEPSCSCDGLLVKGVHPRASGGGDEGRSVWSMPVEERAAVGRDRDLELVRSEEAGGEKVLISGLLDAWAASAAVRRKSKASLYRVGSPIGAATLGLPRRTVGVSPERATDNNERLSGPTRSSLAG